MISRRLLTTSISLLLMACVDAVEIEVPSGYVGEVTLQFESPECPPIERLGFRKIVRVQVDGSYCTSSKKLESTMVLGFYYVDGESRTELKQTMWGDGGMIWGLAGPSSGSDQDGPLRPEYRFLVGTEQELRAIGRL